MHWVWWSVSAWFATLPVGTLILCVLQPAQKGKGLITGLDFQKGCLPGCEHFPWDRSFTMELCVSAGAWGPGDGAWPAVLGPSLRRLPAWLGIQRQCVDPKKNLKSQSECSLKFSSVLGWWLCWWLSSLRGLWLGSGSTLWYFLCRDMGAAEAQESLLLLPRGG